MQNFLNDFSWIKDKSYSIKQIPLKGSMNDLSKVYRIG